jgi:transcriptional regulator with XRE-family HTH domain
LDDQAPTFWDHVRDALTAFMQSHRGLPTSDQKKWSQKELARTMGLSPQRLANFLSARGRTDSINGLALTIACSLGIDLEYNRRRIGLLDRQPDETRQRSSDAQLVLEFGDEFEVAPELTPLTIQLRKGPSSAREDSRPAIRLKISS